jgi:hypothetical protein
MKRLARPKASGGAGSSGKCRERSPTKFRPGVRIHAGAD